jgi:Phosphotransferase enzyme family
MNSRFRRPGRLALRTPELVAYDDACDLLPVPYLVVERVRGEAIGRLDLEPGTTPEVWRELGRDLALLHTGVGEDGPAGQVARPEPQLDPRELVEKRAVEVRLAWSAGSCWSVSAAGATPGHPG